MLKDKIVIVTGGAGFIGSHLVDELIARGFFVRVIDNLIGGRLSNLERHKSENRLEFIEQDITKLSTESHIFRNVAKLFHLAGIGDIVPSIENPLVYFHNNVQGTANLMEAARLNQVRKVVYAASSSCYGMADVPTDEKSRIDLQYPYALTKYLGEMAVFHWGQTYRMHVNSICIFNAYGPRVRTTGAYGAVFGVFLKQRLEGKPLTIVGDGEQQRDFVYVTDVVDAFIRASETSHSGHRFNIGAGKPQKIMDLARLIGGEKVFMPERPGEPKITFANIEKAKLLLKWSPKVQFEEGVNLMLADIDSWKNAPLWDPHSIAQATKSWFKYLGAPRV